MHATAVTYTTESQQAPSSLVSESWVTGVLGVTSQMHGEPMIHRVTAIRGHYFIRPMTWYFTQPVKPSRGSFKDRISRTCLLSYWWRVSVERWIMINKPQKWNCLHHARYAGWLFLSRNIGSEKCECSYQLSCFIQWNTSVSYQCKILSAAHSESAATGFVKALTSF